MGKNVIIFGADMSSSVHVDNKSKDIVILGERPTQELDDSTLTEEAKDPTNFTQSIKRFVLSYTIREGTVSYLLPLLKYITLKQKIWK